MRVGPEGWGELKSVSNHFCKESLVRPIGGSWAAVLVSETSASGNVDHGEMHGGCTCIRSSIVQLIRLAEALLLYSDPLSCKLKLMTHIFFLIPGVTPGYYNR